MGSNFKPIPLENEEAILNEVKRVYMPVLKHIKFTVRDDHSGVDVNFNPILSGLKLLAGVACNLTIIHSLEEMHSELHELESLIRSRVDNRIILESFDHFSGKFHKAINVATENFEDFDNQMTEKGYI